MRFVNPLMRAILRSPIHRLVSCHVALLCYTGRRSGRRFAVPVGLHEIEGQKCLLTNSRWRVNFRGGYDLELLIAGQRRPARGTLVDDPQTVAEGYARLIEQLGRARAGRALGIRINVDRMPTLDEFARRGQRVRPIDHPHRAGKQRRRAAEQP